MGKRLIIVSNRLPYRVEKAAPLKSDRSYEELLEETDIQLERSVGGLASALGPLHEQSGSLWIGMADLSKADSTDDERRDYEQELAEHGCIPVYLTDDEFEGYYDGISNSTIWPLFHDFPQYAYFEEHAWKMYVQVNCKFRDAALAIAQPGDIFWIQDYHLMLLPSMLRAALPDATIGFFLHIPFPDYETFRMLPWRTQLLRGLLGADLVGFHTYDYVRHFLSSCTRILGVDNRMGSVLVDGRLVRADVFPLGIDYDRFSSMAHAPEVRAIETLPPVKRLHEDAKTMLSVERLDYTKGIPDRLRAFDAFLERYPEWIERVTLTLVAVPSRESVSSYQRLKSQVDELVGAINGKYSTLAWSPINYFYRPLPFDELCAAYEECDVMLVTPLRDGMNLVSKEYLALHDGQAGVLILSEMAGAAHELNEAILVNPFDQNALVEAIERALTMPADEQRRRNAMMQERLRRYTSEKWSRDFLESLDAAKEAMNSHLLAPAVQDKLLESYHRAERRAILLDYDGTLVPFSVDPTATSPDRELMTLLRQLARDPRNTLAILSGRDRPTLEKWLGNLGIDMVAEHGVWLWNRKDRTWTLRSPLDDSWKERIRPLLESFVDRSPGSLLEEKDYSLVWHYRGCSAELAERRVAEIKGSLAGLADDMGLQLADGNKIIEVKMANVDKGSAAYRWLSDPSYDFTLVAGDDLTDEDMFHVAPDSTWTIKVGTDSTQAAYAVKSCVELRALLERMLQ